MAKADEDLSFLPVRAAAEAEDLSFLPVRAGAEAAAARPARDFRDRRSYYDAASRGEIRPGEVVSIGGVPVMAVARPVRARPQELAGLPASPSPLGFTPLNPEQIQDIPSTATDARRRQRPVLADPRALPMPTGDAEADLLLAAERTGRTPTLGLARRAAADAVAEFDAAMRRARETAAVPISFTEADIVAEAGRTGRVPYGKILSRAAAEVPLTMAFPTVKEGLLLGLGEGLVRGAGKAGAGALEFLMPEAGPRAAAAIARFLGKERHLFRRGSAGQPPPQTPPGASPGTEPPRPPQQPAGGPAQDGTAEERALAQMLTGEPAPARADLPRAQPVFDTAAQREQLIRQAMLKRTGERVERRVEALRRRADRIKAIREDKAGPLPADQGQAADEIRLIEADAVAELEATAKAMHKDAKLAAGGPSTLEEFVLDRGGIRPYRDPRTGKPIESEDWSVLPKRFRQKQKDLGQAADVIAQDAYEAGLLAEASDKELLRQLQKLPERPANESWRGYLPEAERLALDPESGMRLARRYLELRSAGGGSALPGMAQAAAGARTEAELRRQMARLARDWETKRARLAGETVRTGKAGPDVVGVDEAGDVTASEFAGNVRVSKFPGEDVRFKMRQAAEELGLAQEQPYGGRRGFDETAKMAEQLLAKGVRARDMLKVPRGTALNDAEMRAMQILTDDVFRRAQTAENAAAAAAGRPEAEALRRRAGELWEEAKSVFDRLAEFKTTSGRAVAIQKAMSPEDIDLPTAYLQKVAESEAARRLTGPERTAYLRAEYDKFVKMPKPQQLLLYEKEADLGGFEEFRRNWIKPTLNMWRASLVAQLMTAMRNFTSQTGAALWNVLDDAAAAAGGTAVRAARGEAPAQALRKASAGLVEDFVSFFRRFSPADRQALDDLLGQFPKIREELLGRSAFLEPKTRGTTLAGQRYNAFADKYGEALTWLSRWGEKEQRLYFFEAGLRERIRRAYPELLRKMDLKNLPFDKFQDVAQMAADAADQAMRLTFAKEFRTGVAGGFLRAMRMPVIEELSAVGGATFPRFMANAYSWLWRHGPGTALVETLLTQSGRRGLLTGSPEAMKAVAGSVTGTLALGAALYARSRPETAAGARWYEVRVGTRADGRPNYVNTLAYSPLLAPYLFMAELGLRGTQNLSARDVQQGLLMLRVAGLGRFALDFLSGRLTGESAGRLVKGAGGELLGGFFQPLQTLQEAVAGWDAEERKLRDTRQSPVLGPVMVRIPGLGRLLPEAASPTRAGAPAKESPWLRQLTGFSLQSKNALEARLADIGYDVSTLYPRLGNPRANWLVTRELGQVAEQTAPALLRRLDEEAAALKRRGAGAAEIAEAQRIRVGQAYSHWRKLAMNRALALDPALFRAVKEDRARGGKRLAQIRRGAGLEE